MLRLRYPGLCRAPVPMTRIDRDSIVLGKDALGHPVFLPERPRLEHAHVIGTTGGGKSKFIEHCIRQDIANGSGVCVVDPHGEHPESLYRSLLAWIAERGYQKRRTIHLIDPNSPTHTVGFNPLARPDPETDLSVIAGVTLEAFSRAWGDEDTTGKPTIERVLTAAFTALAELGLTLVEAPFLLDPLDRHGLRAHAVASVTDRYARDELQRLHELSLDERRRRDFDLEVVGPLNRIARFVRPSAIRAMVGQAERVLDIREALDGGHIILCNLSGGARVYERDADLLGRLLTRTLFFHAKRRRKPERPFYVYLDECHRYLSGDLENILAEARKYGIATVLAHQWLSQLSVDSENLLAAVLNATNLKVVFRVKDPKEAEELALAVVPLDLEVPVTTLIKPTVVRHERTRLSSESKSEQWATTASRSEMEGESDGTTVSHVESVGRSDAESASTAVSDVESVMDSTSQTTLVGSGTSSMDTISVSPTQGIIFPVVLGMTMGTGEMAHSESGTSIGSAAGRARGSVSTQGSSTVSTSAEAWGEAHSRATHRARSRGAADTKGRSLSTGSAEAFEPILEDRPSAVHSKDNVLYVAARALRSLTVGKALVNYVGPSGMQFVTLNVPRIPEYRLTQDAFATLREKMLRASFSAIPIAQATSALAERERKLLNMKAAPEPVEPTSFRTKAPAAIDPKRLQPAAPPRARSRKQKKETEGVQ